MLYSINPATLETVQSYNVLSADQVTIILDKVDKQSTIWKNISITKRSILIKRLAKYLKKDIEQYAKLATIEMGKPIQQARSELEKCASLCDFYADKGEEFLQKSYPDENEKNSWVQYEPIGAVLGVMPWNFPFWQVFRFAIPTVLAGNVALLKHASNVPQCGFAIQKLFEEVGFPEHVFTYLPIRSDQVEHIINHPIVQAVSVTGSNEAGSIVASKAAAKIKKAVLELGGSDAFIVCDDADIKSTIEGAMKGRFQNNGQSCIAAKRFLIHESIYDEFLAKFEQKVRDLQLGDPLKEETDIGPLAKKDFVEEIMVQINKTIEQGATLRCGGTAVGSDQQYLLPTILENVKPGMVAFDEEIFGPVAICQSFKDEKEAVSLANHSKFGLGASIWTSSREKAERLLNQINAGTVTVNQIVKSDPRYPFGGIKESGYGRELARNGILEFVNAKTIRMI